MFGKNSDRPPNECQVVEYHPSRQYDPGTELRCTYVTIPQVERTNAIIISRPFWMWGAEMGCNEHGVVIGNEAVFSNEEVPETGLLGMDLLRLGLERGDSATSALDVMVELLECHGQGGICELGGAMMYHNSFIIADPDEAWVLETSQRRWVALRVRDVWSISNGYTITTKWDRGSDDVVEHAVEQGWYDEDSEFDFAAAYGNEAMRYISRCDDRLSCTRRWLRDAHGEIDFFTIAETLRDHPDGWTPWSQEQAAVCQHASHENAYATTGAQISELGSDPVHWFTGSSTTCMSVFWPISFNRHALYDGFDVGGERYTEDSYWWKRERVNRMLTLRFTDAFPRYREIVSEIQGRTYDLYYSGGMTADFEELIEEHSDALTVLSKKISEPSGLPGEFVDYWEKRSKETGVSLDWAGSRDQEQNHGSASDS